MSSCLYFLKILKTMSKHIAKSWRTVCGFSPVPLASPLGCCLLSRSGRYPRISRYQTGTPWRCQNGCNQTANATMSGLRLYDGLIQTCTNQHHVPPTHSLKDAWRSDFQTSAGNPSCSCHTIEKEPGLSNHLKCERHLVQPSPSAESLGPTSSPAPIAMDPARFLNLQNSKELSYPTKVSLPALKPKGFKVQEP